MKNIILALAVVIGLYGCTNQDDQAKKLFLQGTQAYTSGQLDLAADYFTQCISIKKDMHQAYYNRGTVLILQEQYEKAIADFNQCIEMNDKFSLAHYQKGISLQKLNKLPEAIQSYSTAILKDPAFRDAYFNRAWAYLDSQDTIAACQDFSMSKDLGLEGAQEPHSKYCTNN